MKITDKVKMVVTDGDPAYLKAVDDTFPATTYKVRCLWHLARNVRSKYSKIFAAAASNNSSRIMDHKGLPSSEKFDPKGTIIIVCSFSI